MRQSPSRLRTLPGSEPHTVSLRTGRLWICVLSVGLRGQRYKESLRGLRHQTSDMRRSDSWKLSIRMLAVISFYFASAAYAHAIVLYTTRGRRETVRGPMF